MKRTKVNSSSISVYGRSPSFKGLVLLSLPNVDFCIWENRKGPKENTIICQSVLIFLRKYVDKQRRITSIDQNSLNAAIYLENLRENSRYLKLWNALVFSSEFLGQYSLSLRVCTKRFLPYSCRNEIVLRPVCIEFRCNKVIIPITSIINF